MTEGPAVDFFILNAFIFALFAPLAANASFIESNTGNEWEVYTSSSRGGQAEPAQSPDEASGMCASMGYQLPPLNLIHIAFERGVWRHISGPMPVSGKSARFWTSDSGEFPLLGDSYILYQPFSYPKYDYYSKRQRVLVAYVLCVRKAIPPQGSPTPISSSHLPGSISSSSQTKTRALQPSIRPSAKLKAPSRRVTTPHKPSARRSQLK